MSGVLNVLITHQSPDHVERMVRYWSRHGGSESCLVVFGGEAAVFEQLDFRQKLLVRSPRLQTKDHQREKQTYHPIWIAVADWLRGRAFSHLYVAEYDHVPLVEDLHTKLRDHLVQEKADVLGHRLIRVDGSSNLHYLYHLSDPEFLPFWRTISRRREKEVVLKMLGTGSFWTRESFDAVAAVPEQTPVYLELFLPTAAHHLGFRVRGYGAGQDRFVHSSNDLSAEEGVARAAGAWTLHPAKKFWESSRS